MMKRIAMAVLAAALSTIGCGGGSNNAAPMLIPEGGVGSGAIDGKVNVYVIDSASNAPIMGASVFVGDLVGTTDATGLHTFEEGSLSGAQTISVTMSGYAAATWVGANGANVTIPIDKNGAASVDTATITGTIEGWSTLPAPAMNHYLLALVQYSFTSDLGDPANNIVQGTGTGGLPDNACIKAPPILDQCDFTLKTRTGAQTLYAAILDGDSNGTLADFSDDTYTVVTYAVKAGLTLTKDQMLTGETLAQLDAAADLQEATFTLPTAPTGLDQLTAIPVIDLGDQWIVMPLPAITPQNTTATVPKLAGDFAAGHYMVVGRATPMMMDTPATTTISRNADFGSTFTLPAWLLTATGLTATDRTFAFTPVAEATVHSADFSTASGEKAWGVVLLDGSTTFTLPTLPGVTDPLPVGMVTYKVSALDVANFDPENFSLENIFDDIARLSETEIDFTH